MQQQQHFSASLQHSPALARTPEHFHPRGAPKPGFTAITWSICCPPLGHPCHGGGHGYYVLGYTVRHQVLVQLEQLREDAMADLHGPGLNEVLLLLG